MPISLPNYRNKEDKEGISGPGGPGRSQPGHPASPGGCHYKEQINDGEVGKVERSDTRTVERGGTGDVLAVTGVRADTGLPSRVSKVLYTNLELMQMHPHSQSMPPSMRGRPGSG